MEERVSEMNDERLWTVYVTSMEEAVLATELKCHSGVWEVTYALYDQDFPHRIDTLSIQADHEIDVFYKFQARVKSWIDQGPFYGRNIKIVWFKEEV
jgi:hypothetical protein